MRHDPLPPANYCQLMGYGRIGAFEIPHNGTVLTVIASDGSDWQDCGFALPAWEHVSVSTPKRCPTWEEMDYIKRMWWRDDETVIQFHVPRSHHVNAHPYCLHMWKPIGIELPRPPLETVAPAKFIEATP